MNTLPLGSTQVKQLFDEMEYRGIPSGDLRPAWNRFLGAMHASPQSPEPLNGHECAKLKWALGRALETEDPILIEECRAKCETALEHRRRYDAEKSALFGQAYQQLGQAILATQTAVQAAVDRWAEEANAIMHAAPVTALTFPRFIPARIRELEQNGRWAKELLDHALDLGCVPGYEGQRKEAKSFRQSVERKFLKPILAAAGIKQMVMR